MDTSDLFISCKKGDVGRVRYLLEQRDVEINVRDKWDSTPLYYACLCGHEELVRYLLASGAKCEANTFDGERCLYGALSDTIRRVLKEYKQITAKCMKRDYYDVFLQRLLEQGYQSDIVFIVHGKSFCAHRCILSARSTYFAEMFDTKWKGKNVIALKHPLINPAAFGSLLQYLYTGRLDIDVEYVNDCKRLAKQCRLQDLIEDLEMKCKKVYEFVSSKPGTCVKVLTIDPAGDSRLQEDLALLADCALPAELRVGFGELPFDSTDNFSSCPDVCFRVANYNFLCHKAFFCGRSDYFKALLEDHFSESEELKTQPSIPVVTLHDISEDIFIRVLYYIYSDDTECLRTFANYVRCMREELSMEQPLTSPRLSLPWPSETNATLIILTVHSSILYVFKGRSHHLYTFLFLSIFWNILYGILPSSCFIFCLAAHLSFEGHYAKRGSFHSPFFFHFCVLFEKTPFLLLNECGVEGGGDVESVQKLCGALEGLLER
uniref:Ankyrin repeat and BTB/POZ domain-containing protein 1 isoform X1 n=1 Tax=Pogona vitticeps TaxID=103695 RepID=A0A6J0U338_9SAUR